MLTTHCFHRLAGRRRALANVALARALESDPGYTMALLLLEAVGGGLPPSAARLPMTPEETAAHDPGGSRRFLCHRGWKAKAGEEAALCIAKGRGRKLAGSAAQQNMDLCRTWLAGGPGITCSHPGRTASRFATRDRPGYQRLLADITAGKLDVVVLWEASRGDRKLATWAQFLDACCEQGTGIYITSHGRLYDMANGRDWRNLVEDGVDSGYESGEDVDPDPARRRREDAGRGTVRPHRLRLRACVRSPYPAADRTAAQYGTRQAWRHRRVDESRGRPAHRPQHRPGCSGQLGPPRPQPPGDSRSGRRRTGGIAQLSHHPAAWQPQHQHSQCRQSTLTSES